MFSILSKNQIKFIRLLKQKKNRYKFKKYLVEGKKLILDIMNLQPDLVDFVVIDTESGGIEYPKHTTVISTDPETFRSISNMVNPQGVLAVCHIPEEYFLPAFPDFEFALFFDGVQDPGNLGTLLRAADWFGVQQVLIGPGTVDPYSPKVIQAAMGSHAFLKINMAEPEVLSDMPHTIIGTDMHGMNAYRFSWPDRGILVLGNEGQGMSSAIRKLDMEIVTLPGASVSSTESLNVSMACTALLTLRQAADSKVIP